MEELSTVAVRVVGALIEKEITTPDVYPLTINALTTACNQSSNRDPVMTLDDATVMDAVVALSKRGLVREVQRADSRARRYRQTFSEALHLHAAETAIMCVLMLRGPQTTGELRTRTARLHEFTELAQVDITLQSLMGMAEPLVVQLPRQPGQKEVRYAHLLSGEPQLPAHSAPTVQEATSIAPTRVDRMAEEIAALRAELTELKARFEEFRRQFQ